MLVELPPLRALAPLAACAWLCACQSVAHQPAARHGFMLDPGADVDDETIASALDATEGPVRPQLPESHRLAYYAFDRRRGDGLRTKLAALPGVTGFYQIATDARGGEGRPTVRSRDYLGEPAPVSLRRLRLLAARSRCEVLVVADYGFRHAEDGNSWVMTAPLVLPLFFAPMVDVRVESYLDVYVVDVRSGRLIAQIQSDQLDVAPEQTLFHDTDAHLLDAQWVKLQTHAEDELEKLFADPARREQPTPQPAQPPAEPTETPTADPFELPADPEEG